MTRFRPCIDLHDGRVKQIVGGSLRDDTPDATQALVENHVSPHDAGWFATRYCQDRLTGGHVIKLGPGNDAAAEQALANFSGGLQVGGGIDIRSAQRWLDAGASHVIVTSWLFDDSGVFQPDRLQQLVSSVGAKRLVIDLSCKKTADGYRVAMNRWQTLTSLEVNERTLDKMADFCDEFLIHAADVEGLCQGVDLALVEQLGKWGKRPMTYAGGISSMNDVYQIQSVGQGNLDFTVGSALDLFGGNGVCYAELVQFNRTQDH